MSRASNSRAAARVRRAATRCARRWLASRPRGSRVIVVDDASPEPELAAALDRLAAHRKITLIRHAENKGFPAAANAGLRACAGRDVVLLNSDTLVPPGWLGRLRAAAYAAADIGTVTPLSNDATILSYPDRDGGNPVPDLAEVAALDALAQQANGGVRLIDGAVGVHAQCVLGHPGAIAQGGLPAVAAAGHDAVEAYHPAKPIICGPQ